MKHEELVLLGAPCRRCNKPIYSKPKKDGSPKRVSFCLREECRSERHREYQIGRKDRPSSASRNGKLRGPFTCQHCASEYHTRRRKGEGEKYCSRECSHGAMAATPYCKVYVGRLTECQECSKPFVSKRRERYCSTKCGKAAAIKNIRESAEKRHKKSAKAIDCSVCGVVFTRLYGNKSRICSSECKDERVRVLRRSYKSKRRAKIRGNGKVELFDPFYVFSRDKWKCRCCGINTPRSKRGSIDDNAPELDHIIPISEGGEHSKKNTQCLCRKCNQTKSSGALGDQLLLLG